MLSKRQIKARLRKKNITQVEVARRLGISQTMLTQFISGRVTSARVELGLAHILGMSVAEFRGEEKAA